MRRLRLLTLIALSIATATSPAAETGAPAGGVCRDPAIQNDWQIGLSLQQILPAGLPDFLTRSQPAYGITAGMPLGRDTVQFLAQYGGIEQFSLLSFELNYRLLIPTPFVTVYTLAGGHYLRYSQKGVSRERAGANVGFGVLLPLSPRFHVQLGAKGYLRDATILAFGGGFNFLL